MYFIFVSISSYKRTRYTNILLFTIGPYSSNFVDIIKAISTGLLSLNRSTKVETSFSNITLIVFSLAFIGNIP